MNWYKPYSTIVCFLCLILCQINIPYNAFAKASCESVKNSPLAKRIISLAPSITEILFALGAGSSVIGRTTYATYPPEAEKLPTVGSYYRPELERIVALQPDLCIANNDGNPKAILDRLESMNIKVERYDADSIEALLKTIKLLGERTQTQERASQLIADAHTRLAAYAKRVQARPFKPRVLIQLQMNPIITASENTYIGHLVNLAGAENVVKGNVPYPRLSDEEVFLLAPDIILTAKMHPDMEGTPTGVLKNILQFNLNPDIFNRPTLRSLDAIGTLLDYFDTLNPVITLAPKNKP